MKAVLTRFVLQKTPIDVPILATLDPHVTVKTVTLDVLVKYQSTCAVRQNIRTVTVMGHANFLMVSQRVHAKMAGWVSPVNTCHVIIAKRVLNINMIAAPMLQIAVLCVNAQMGSRESIAQNQQLISGAWVNEPFLKIY